MYVQLSVTRNYSKHIRRFTWICHSLYIGFSCIIVVLMTIVVNIVVFNYFVYNIILLDFNAM